MTDHDIAMTVNKLRDIAKEYGQTQQLRERIASVVVPLLSASKPAAQAHCQCSACKPGTIHASDCAVHNAPALPVGECDCGIAAPAQSAEPDIKVLVNRFLAWPLPQTVCSDGCVINSSYAFPRSGTNLLNADEAEAMLRHVLAAPQPSPTAVVLDDERAAFEAWGNETFNYGFQPDTWDAGEELPVAREACYQHEGTQMAWEGWQARATIPQPVAQPVEQISPIIGTQAPFSNCRFKFCDLPGQCRDEGKCHHPAVPAAQPVEQTRALTEDARDSARYRWLRDKSEPGICAFYLSVGKAFDGVKFKRETVDAAIDAQIEADRTAARPASGETAC